MSPGLPIPVLVLRAISTARIRFLRIGAAMVLLHRNSRSRLT